MDETMTVNHQLSIFRRLLSAVVPMLLVAMSYIDPGKWAAAAEGGARYESNIVLLMLVFNLAAILCQYLSARIAVVTEKDLGQICSEEYGKVTCIVLGLQSELSMIVLDLTMILGTAHGLNLIFGVDLFTCVFLTAADAILFPVFSSFSEQKAKVLCIYTGAFMLFSYIFGTLISQSGIPLSIGGRLINLSGETSPAFMSLLGASVMPHNFYLHSSLVKGPNETPYDSDLTRHASFVDLPDTSEVDRQKNGGTGNINYTPLIVEVQTGDGSKVEEKYYNGERDSTCVRSNGGISECNYVYRTKAEEYKMIAELGMCPQLSAMVSSEARTKNAKTNKKKKEELVIAPMINEGLKSDNFSSNSVYGAKAEEYKMFEDQSEKDQLAIMHALDARMREKNRKIRENRKKKKKMVDLEPDAKISSGLNITPEDMGSTHFIDVALPDTSGAQSGDCSEVVGEYKNGEKANKGVRSDGGINRDNYVYRTKAEEYKMIAELGMSSQLSAMVASKARMKKSVIKNEKGLKKTQQLTNYPADVAQSSEVQKKKCTEGVFEVTNVDGVKPVIGVYKYRTKAEEYRMLADLSSCSQDAAMFVCEHTIMDNRKSNRNKGTDENQNSAVACVADEQEGNFLKTLETTEEINTNDGLRSAIVIDPGLSFSEGREETACLGNTSGNPEIEQIEAPVREEEEKVFDRRDCGDIAAEIVELGGSIKAAESAPSLKLGSMKKKARKPRYYDFPNSSLQMCNICGEDDHKAAECTMVRRKKPCYLCGGFRHTAKRCSQGRECFKCGGRGHLARVCLEERLSNNIIDFCLRCGDSGHHMFICQNEYSSEDLKHIQCYVCKDFGHLCCDSFRYEGQTVSSCYKCGQSGHLGSECIRQEKCTRYSVANSFCNHEVKGHFAGNNREYNKAGQCTRESTTVERSSLDKEILPNFAHAPFNSGQGVPSNQGQRCGGLIG